jgi:hypothetical protein
MVFDAVAIQVTRFGSFLPISISAGIQLFEMARCSVQFSITAKWRSRIGARILTSHADCLGRRAGITPLQNICAAVDLWQMQ